MGQFGIGANTLRHRDGGRSYPTIIHQNFYWEI
jgi:hypothetical protein